MTALLPRPGVAGVAAIELSADTLSPVSAALRLRDRLAFILESVEGGARYGRYSMVGVRGRILSVTGDVASVLDADYAEVDRFAIDDPLEALRQVLVPSTDKPRDLLIDAKVTKRLRSRFVPRNLLSEKVDQGDLLGCWLDELEVVDVHCL